jgi:8-oxo-dGTP diphosphatase
MANTSSSPPVGPRVGSAVVIMDGDRVLLGVRGKEPNKGKWVIPGGKVKQYESIESGGVREALEETGLLVVIEEQIGVWEIINPPEHRVIVYSKARAVGGTLKAGSDLDEVRYFAWGELDALDISETVRSVLVKVRSEMHPNHGVADDQPVNADRLSKVGDLLKRLAGVDPETLVVLASDREGNSFSPLCEAETTNRSYFAETSFSGEVAYVELTEDLATRGFTDDDVATEAFSPAVVLWPTN